MMRIPAFIGLCVIVLTGCKNKDCSKIDLATLSDIKLPADVKPQATKLEEIPVELDVYLHSTMRLILRCRTEEDVERDKVLPGVMLWIADSWKLDSDTSRFGKLFFDKGIARWERPRVIGILYHRHLLDQPLLIDSLLRDAQVRSEFHGRVKSYKMKRMMTTTQQAQLKQLIISSDSIQRLASRTEFKLSLQQRRMKSIEETLHTKANTLAMLELISDDVQHKNSPAKDISLLSDSVTRKSFSDFTSASAGQQLLLIERTKVAVVASELGSLAKVGIEPLKKSVPTR